VTFKELKEKFSMYATINVKGTAFQAKQLGFCLASALQETRTNGRAKWTTHMAFQRITITMSAS
jgi:hypothetical protein